MFSGREHDFGLKTVVIVDESKKPGDYFVKGS